MKGVQAIKPRTRIILIAFALFMPIAWGVWTAARHFKIVVTGYIGPGADG